MMDKAPGNGCFFIRITGDQKQFMKTHKKIIVNIITMVLVVVLCGFTVRSQQPATPDNPIAKQTQSIEIETMMLNAGPDDTQNSEESDANIKGTGNNGQESEETERDSDKSKSEMKQDSQQQQNAEESRDSKQENVNSVGEGEHDSILDGINDSDEAEDEKGNGMAGEESPFPDDKEDVHIATDLRNQIITESQLKDDKFEFYAYLVHAEDDMQLKVKLRNEKTSQNGKYLKSENKNYDTKLARGYNYITLYIVSGNSTYYQITYAINYMADKADENNPQVGEHPPIIKTNLDDHSGTIKNRNFIFTVSAETYRNEFVPYDNIRVIFDGKQLKTTPTGNETYEYDLYFENPREGDTSQHTVHVLAWDNEGNSSYKTFDVTYEFRDQGDTIGTATVSIDATTLGLGIIASGYQYEIKQDEPASYAVIAAMEEWGIDLDYGGTPDVGFYIRGLSNGYIANGAGIPANLWSKIIDDGLNLTGQSSRNRIAEFDYTEGSGWMYTINGGLYPGRGLSGYYLNDGDNIILRFTLAYGKDLGAVSSRGLLKSYCGLWINGGYTPRHNLDNGKVLTEATCETAGEWARTCTVRNCREKITEIIPALGHQYQLVEQQDATAASSGYVKYRCSRCGREQTDMIPPLGGEVTPSGQEIPPSEEGNP